MAKHMVHVLTKAFHADNKQKNVIETAEIGAASLAKSWNFLDRYASCRFAFRHSNCGFDQPADW